MLRFARGIAFFAPLALYVAACSLVTSLDGYAGGEGVVPAAAEAGTVAETGTPPPPGPSDGSTVGEGGDASGDAGSGCADGGILRGGVCLAKPVAHWTFDEGTGVIAGDSAGTANGSISGATWVPGHVGPYALSFDGVGNSVSIGQPAQLSFGTTSFSYTLLVNMAAFAGQYDVAWWKGGSSMNEIGYDMELGSAGWGAGLSDGTTSFTVSFGPPILGAWTRLVVVVDRGANEVRLYKNSVLADTKGIASFGSTASNRSATIGGGNGSDYFKGTIDDVIIFDRALTPGEITALNP